MQRTLYRGFQDLAATQSPAANVGVVNADAMQHGCSINYQPPDSNTMLSRENR